MDAAVDKAYGRKFKDPSSPLRGSAEAGDADCVAHLFELYKKLTEGKQVPYNKRWRPPGSPAWRGLFGTPSAFIPVIMRQSP